MTFPAEESCVGSNELVKLPHQQRFLSSANYPVREHSVGHHKIVFPPDMGHKVTPTMHGVPGCQYL